MDDCDSSLECVQVTYLHCRVDVNGARRSTCKSENGVSFDWQSSWCQIEDLIYLVELRTHQRGRHSRSTVTGGRARSNCSTEPTPVQKSSWIETDDRMSCCSRLGEAPMGAPQDILSPALLGQPIQIKVVLDYKKWTLQATQGQTQTRRFDIRGHSDGNTTNQLHQQQQQIQRNERLDSVA